MPLERTPRVPTVLTDAHAIVADPVRVRATVTQRTLAWMALMAARGRRCDQRRLMAQAQAVRS